MCDNRDCSACSANLEVLVATVSAGEVAVAASSVHRTSSRLAQVPRRHTPTRQRCVTLNGCCRSQPAAITTSTRTSVRNHRSRNKHYGESTSGLVRATTNRTPRLATSGSTICSLTMWSPRSWSPRTWSPRTFSPTALVVGHLQTTVTMTIGRQRSRGVSRKPKCFHRVRLVAMSVSRLQYVHRNTTTIRRLTVNATLNDALRCRYSFHCPLIDDVLPRGRRPLPTPRGRQEWSLDIAIDDRRRLPSSLPPLSNRNRKRVTQNRKRTPARRKTAASWMNNCCMHIRYTASDYHVHPVYIVSHTSGTRRATVGRSDQGRDVVSFNRKHRGRLVGHMHRRTVVKHQRDDGWQQRREHCSPGHLQEGACFRQSNTPATFHPRCQREVVLERINVQHRDHSVDTDRHAEDHGVGVLGPDNGSRLTGQRAVGERTATSQAAEEEREPSTQGTTYHHHHPRSVRSVLDAVARAVAADWVLWHWRGRQRIVCSDATLRYLVLAVLSQQSHQPVLLCVRQSAVQEDVHSHSAPWLATQIARDSTYWSRTDPSINRRYFNSVVVKSYIIDIYTSGGSSQDQSPDFQATIDRLPEDRQRQ